MGDAKLTQNPRKKSKIRLFGLPFSKSNGNIYLKFENPKVLGGV